MGYNNAVEYICTITGMSDGQTIRVMIDGTEVLATVYVEQSRHFRREGFNVYSDVTISFTLVTTSSLQLALI